MGGWKDGRRERSEEWEDGRMGGGRVLYLMASGKTVVSSSYRE